ncbi:hypothetical protein SeMB42_g05097 [Synchytrium endobioticum]|uniref:RRM domain-containing protein n=1 Tax=Synchytrium endobioticum TaxID=286115 RepID=A0A507CII4_9FUNG|nr:hypothetical protein SeLEV6574_g07813 [Synchytrium endobioticum]TPX42499.1 hypothetical protein SeMB42_g05097 [Synchytrium endobioticum]
MHDQRSHAEYAKTTKGDTTHSPKQPETASLAGRLFLPVLYTHHYYHNLQIMGDQRSSLSSATQQIISAIHERTTPTLHINFPRDFPYPQLRRKVTVPIQRIVYAKNKFSGSAFLVFKDPDTAENALLQLMKLPAFKVELARHDSVHSANIPMDEPTHRLEFRLPYDSFPRKQLEALLAEYIGFETIDLQPQTPVATFQDAIAAMKAKDHLNLTTNIKTFYQRYRPPVVSGTLTGNRRYVNVSYLRIDDDLCDLRNLFAQYADFKRMHVVDSDCITLCFGEEVSAMRAIARIKATTTYHVLLVDKAPPPPIRPPLDPISNILSVGLETWFDAEEAAIFFASFEGFSGIRNHRDSCRVLFINEESAAIACKTILNTTNINCSYYHPGPREQPVPSIHFSNQSPEFIRSKALFERCTTGFRQLVFGSDGSFHALFDNEAHCHAAVESIKDILGRLMTITPYTPTQSLPTTPLPSSSDSVYPITPVTTPLTSRRKPTLPTSPLPSDNKTNATVITVQGSPTPPDSTLYPNEMLGNGPFTLRVSGLENTDKEELRSFAIQTLGAKRLVLQSEDDPLIVFESEKTASEGLVALQNRYAVAQIDFCVYDQVEWPIPEDVWKPSTVLQISHSGRITENDLRQLLSPYGGVNEMIYDQRKAVVKFDKVETAEIAYEILGSTTNLQLCHILDTQLSSEVGQELSR